MTETLKPISVKEIKPGVFIYDLGQNMVGWCRLKVRGAAGATVTLRHAEILKPDGTLYLDNIRGARVTDHYTLKGSGTEIYEPRFTYHGFRFVEVTGFPGRPTLADLTGCVVHDDVASAGDWASSNELLNQILRNVHMPLSGRDFTAALVEAGIAVLPIEPAHTVALDDLPLHHRDPFDRLLIATAQHEGFRLLTSDAQLSAYGDLVLTV